MTEAINGCDKEVRIKYRMLINEDPETFYVVACPIEGIEKKFSTLEEADAEALRIAKNSTSSHPVFVRQITAKPLMIYERWAQEERVGK